MLNSRAPSRVWKTHIIGNTRSTEYTLHVSLETAADVEASTQQSLLKKNSI